MAISDAIVVVECDVCSHEEEVTLTSLAHPGSWDERNVKREMERQGWRMGERGAAVCPDCIEDEARIAREDREDDA